MIIESGMIFTGRGSTALYAILKAIDFSVRKVLVPVNICEICIPVIEFAGFTVVFYDVDEFTGVAGLDHIREKFTGSETVLIAVHNFGIPLDIAEISSWAWENELFVIEDVCNSQGASLNNEAVGTYSDAAIYSFGSSKIIDVGLGGGALVKNPDIRQEVDRLVSEMDCYSSIHAENDKKFQFQLRTLRSDPANFTPEVYRPLYQEYLKYLLYRVSNDVKRKVNEGVISLPENLAMRNEKANCYRLGIVSDAVEHIDAIPGQVYWRYNLLVETDRRDRLIREILNSGLWASTWYPPINALFEGTSENEYPGASRFSKKIVNLFVDHRISSSDIYRTIDLINHF